MAAAVEEKTEFRAEARYVRTTPRKAQLVVSEIRGRTVPEAKVVLAFMTRDAAHDVESVLDSAVANAEANYGYSGDDLYVSAAVVGTGPTLKRWRARARGRVGRIKKRTCHITIKVAPLDEEAVVATSPEPEPRPRRSRKKAEPEAAALVTPAEAPTEETPPGPPAAKAPVVEEAPAEEAPAKEAPAEEAPKPRRARKKPEPTAEEPPVGEATAEPSTGEQAAAEETPPKPRRTRTKPAEPAPEAEKEN